MGMDLHTIKVENEKNLSLTESEVEILQEAMIRFMDIVEDDEEVNALYDKLVKL